MGNLTVKQIEASRAQTKPYKLMDGDGLQLRVATDGTKTWLVRYMLDGKERQYRLPEPYGDGPGRFGLKEARESATHIRSLARKKVDIHERVASEREAELSRIEQSKADSKTVSDLFAEWVKTVDRKDEGKELRRLFNRDVFPSLGQMPLRDVNPEHIQKILQTVVNRGANRIAVTLFSDMKQMYRWAGRKRAWKSLFENPTDEIDLKKDRILPKDYDGAERNRALSEKEVTELAEKLPQSGLTPQAQIAMLVMLSCCCRIAEVIRARWEHVDLDKAEWTIPKENSKNRQAHTIFLSTFALDQLRRLKELNQSKTWCFPDKTGSTHLCTKATTKQVRDRQIKDANRKPMKHRAKNSDALLLANGDWVPHDLRRTGATMMQSLKIAPSVIERVLNHVEPSKLTRTYQTYDYAEEKKDAWSKLGAKISALVESS